MIQEQTGINRKNKRRIMTILINAILVITFVATPTITAAGNINSYTANLKGKSGIFQTARSETPEMDCDLISVSINDVSYDIGDAHVKITAGDIFSFRVVMKNTGTETWGQFLDEGERGSTLFSRGPDYNETFGVFFISPGQGTFIPPGETKTYDTRLRAPMQPGEYTMIWQMADWIIPYIHYQNMSYPTRPFYGDIVRVEVTVTERADQPPAVKPRVPGVVDALDFEYEGSFALPDVPGTAGGDEKSYFESGITLRTVNGEKRMILGTGTYKQTLYEVAIPEPGMIVDGNCSAVPVAQLRTVFGHLPIAETASDNGTIWYDEVTELLYWTNCHGYLTGYPDFPVLRCARLGEGVLTQMRQWYLPPNTPDQFKAFWGGVTGIPEDFANLYTGGRKIALGFGGTYSIVSTTSMGPALAAISPDLTKDDIDFHNIMYYPYNDFLENYCIRDGNYIPLYGWSPIPTSPWEGRWTGADSPGSGVFIDLPDKKGYIEFVHQVIGRLGYDYGGANWNGKYQNTWYFYDFDTLGKAATGEISNIGLEPSSLSVIKYPFDSRVKQDQFVAGSCFDKETRRLYIYTMWSLYDGGGNPAVHVYKVKEDTPARTITGQVFSYNPRRETSIKLYTTGTDNLIASTTIEALSTGSGQTTQKFRLVNVPEGVYDLVVSKETHLNYTITGITVRTADIDLTENPDGKISTILLPCGDINRDGYIDSSDLSIIILPANYDKHVTAPGANPLADLTGTGWTDSSSLSIIILPANYDKTHICVAWER